MLKNRFIFILILFSFSSFAQIPDGYYNSANGLTGESLKSALHEIIKNHVEFPYTSSSTDTWDIIKESDKDTANPNNVIMFYSGWSVNAEQEYNNATGWSREHVWAKSHGDFGTDLGAGTDCHHLRPADISVNSARGNDDFDTGGTIYVDGDGTTDCRTDSDSWEPRDAVKGDVARMLFYMAVRYNDLDVVPGNPDDSTVGELGDLDSLLVWHATDIADDYEMNRNNVVYNWQKNRNPFIDLPELVDYVFGTKSAEIWNSSSSINNYQNEMRFYPNPVINELTFDRSVSGEFSIVNMVGAVVLKTQINSNRVDLSNLMQGLYTYQLKTGANNYQGKIIKK